MRTILFKGHTSTKTLDLSHHRGTLAQVTPFLVTQDEKNVWDEDEVHMGLLLQCTPLSLRDGADEDTSLEPFEQFNGHSASFNPIRWWRALQFLEALPDLSDTVFSRSLYWGIDRNPNSSFKHRVDALRQVVGSQQYDQIMARPVPEVITRLLIQMADDGQDVHSALHTASEEIDAGTIRWSQELRRIGVKHPDYWRAYASAEAEVVARYQSYLFGYAAYRQYRYGRDRKQKEQIMREIEGQIVVCVERGIEGESGPDVAALVAILTAEIWADDVLEAVEERHHSGRRERGEPFTRPTPGQQVGQVFAWFAGTRQAGLLCFEQFQETETLVVSLLERFDKLPVVRPLVPEPQE